MPLPATFVKGFHDEEAVSKMEYRQFGATSMKVSKLGIGGATLANFFGEPNEAEAIETFQKAIKSGINYVDTAPFYDRSQEIVGKALKGVPRSAYYIATKVGRYASKQFETMFDYSAKKTRESVENSLRLLGLDYIDVIQIHDIEFAPDLDMILNECLPTVEALVKEGKVKYIGVSAYPMGVLKEIISRAPGRFNTVLCYARYSLLDHSLLEYLPFFQEQKLAIICASVHALGLLSNDGPQPFHPVKQEIKDICRKAGEICKQNGIELGKLAMYYGSELKEASIFLVGIQNRKLLDINLDAVVNGLTKKEMEVLEHLKKEYFTQSVNWEGIEVKAYNEYMSKLRN